MITLISGTNRLGSYTLKVVEAAYNFLQKNGVEVQILNLVNLPQEIFRPDAYDETPNEFACWQAKINNSDGIIIVCPEYNGGIPGVLKYFIDMLEFPKSLSGTPVALIGVAAGHFGGLRPVEQLSILLQYRNAHVFGERLFVPKCETEAIAYHGFENPSLQGKFENLLLGFSNFTKKINGIVNQDLVEFD